MLISEIKSEPLRKLAEKRRAEYLGGANDYSESNKLPFAFPWIGTDEGFDFWDYVNTTGKSPLYFNPE